MAYISYLIGPTSGGAQECMDYQTTEWMLTFKPWLLPRIQGQSGYMTLFKLLKQNVPYKNASWF